MAETVRLRGEGGSVFTHDLPLHPDIQKRVAKGYLRVIAETEDSADPVEVDRPAKSATKAEWVGWAVHVHELAPDDAEAMTKDDLQELPDAPEAVEETDEDGGE